MEKNLSSYFNGRHCWIKDRSVDQEGILLAISNSSKGEIAKTDLHKGIKKLWDDGFVDCRRTKYKKPYSVADETMDHELGIRVSNPELYTVLKTATLLDVVFQVDKGAACTVSAFHMSPSEGTVIFPRYSEKKGDTDHVIREILRHN
jgi:hypothetical protein